MCHLKKAFFIITFLFCLCSFTFSQIGINTENVQSYLLYFDGGSTTATKNPTTGTISNTQITDDVIISKDGTVGIGTTPSAITKLTVKTSKIGNALKMTDTSEGLYKALVSIDDNGNASWTSIGGVWYAMLSESTDKGSQTANTTRKLGNYTSAYMSDTSTGGSINAKTGDITVPYTGSYRITITGWMGYGRPGSTSTPGGYYINTLYIYRNAAHLYSFNAVSLKRWGMNQTFYRIVDVNAGDVLSIYKNETSTSNGADSSPLSLLVDFLY